MASTLELLRRLSRQNVEFVLIGGMAAVVHGATSVTEDVDLCVLRDLEAVQARVARHRGTSPP